MAKKRPYAVRSLPPGPCTPAALRPRRWLSLLRLLNLPCARASRLSSLFHVGHAGLQAAGRERWGHAGGRGPTRTRTRLPCSCRRTSGTGTRRSRGRSGRRRPRCGTASSALAGCFKAVAVAVVVVVLVAMQERCKSLLPCECFTACLPAACHVHTFLCLMKYCYLQAPCCCPLPCCLPSSCAGMLRTWLTYRGGAFPQGPP